MPSSPFLKHSILGLDGPGCFCSFSCCLAILSQLSCRFIFLHLAMKFCSNLRLCPKTSSPSTLSLSSQISFPCLDSVVFHRPMIPKFASLWSCRMSLPHFLLNISEAPQIQTIQGQIHDLPCQTGLLPASIIHPVMKVRNLGQPCRARTRVRRGWCSLPGASPPLAHPGG